MLGRYVAGTLLVLGVAMVMAPDAPDAPEPETTRAGTAPAMLATASPEAMASAVQTRPEAATPVSAPVPEKDLGTSVEAALVQALALDETEAAAEQPADAVARQGEAADDGRDESDEPLVMASTFAELRAPPAVPASDLPDTEPVDAAPTPAPARLLYVTGTRVNVRAGPSTQYRVVGTVDYGDAVELVTYEGSGWARIRLEDGETTGFMSRRFLENELAGG